MGLVMTNIVTGNCMGCHSGGRQSQGNGLRHIQGAGVDDKANNLTVVLEILWLGKHQESEPIFRDLLTWKFDMEIWE